MIVDEVDEVLTVEDAQFDEVPGADNEPIDSIAKLGRPSRRAAQAQRSSRATSTSSAATGRLSTLSGRCTPPPLGSSSPMTAAMMRQIVCLVARRAPVSRSSAVAANGDEALAALRARAPGRADARPRRCPGSTGSACCGLCASAGRPTCRSSSSPRSPVPGGARAVDALAEGAFDLVAKPAVGEGLDALRGQDGSVDQGATQPPTSRGRRDAACRAQAPHVSAASATPAPRVPRPAARRSATKLAS